MPLDASTFHKLVTEQMALDRSVTDTLRAYGLDVAPPERDGDKLTKDEETVTTLATGAAMAAMLRGGPQGADPVALALEGILVGLALGYACGVREGNPFETDETPDTFPENWQGDGNA